MWYYGCSTNVCRELVWQAACIEKRRVESMVINLLLRAIAQTPLPSKLRGGTGKLRWRESSSQLHLCRQAFITTKREMQRTYSSYSYVDVMRRARSGRLFRQTELLYSAGSLDAANETGTFMCSGVFPKFYGLEGLQPWASPLRIETCTRDPA